MYGGLFVYKKVVLFGDVVTPIKVIHNGYVLVEENKITGISLQKPEITTAIAFYDYHDQYIFPGFIDAHVHCFSNPNEGFEATSIGAAVGGVTTFVDMPYDRPKPIDTADRFEEKKRSISGKTVVDIALWATIAKHNGIKEIPGLVEAGAAAFKMSTFETDPQRFPKISDVDIYESLEMLKKSNVFVAFHSENNEMIVDLIDRYRKSERVYARAHMETRPIIVETTAVQKLCEIAKWTHGHLHIVHVSAPETIDIIESYRKQGVDVTCETCYQYLVLNVDDLEHMGPRAKMNPPLREQAEVDGLWNQLRDGKINYVTSDHVPWDEKDKQKGEKNIFDAPSGLPGIELLGPVMYDAAIAHGVGLVQLSQLLSTQVAKRFNFTQKGSIELSKDADFTIIDPSKSTLVSDDALHTKTKSITPLAGRTLAGRVRSTWVRGHEVYRDGKILAPLTYGQFVTGERLEV